MRVRESNRRPPNRRAPLPYRVCMRVPQIGMHKAQRKGGKERKRETTKEKKKIRENKQKHETKSYTYIHVEKSDKKKIEQRMTRRTKKKQNEKKSLRKTRKTRKRRRKNSVES